jgi:hypothetical protein
LISKKREEGSVPSSLFHPSILLLFQMMRFKLLQFIQKIKLQAIALIILTAATASRSIVNEMKPILPDNHSENFNQELYISFPIKNDGEIFSKHFSIESLSPFQNQIFEGFINEAMPGGLTISAVLDKQPGTRNTMRLAMALLFRNRNGDAENAASILKWIFSLQNTNEKSRDFGVWKGSPKEAVYADQNMREFIGTDLIIVYHKYKNILPPDLKKELETCLIRTARGALRRDVDPDYNNISIMSSFMMEYVGSEFNLPELKAAGIKKAKEIYTNFHKYNTLCEYNSPTYYGVDFVGLALWRELAFSGELHRMAVELENALWLDVAEFYNANLQNICGPFLRSYGMDMKKYTAIIGVWIASAVDNPEIATIPGKSGSHNESDFIVPILELGISMPVKALEHFRKFGSPRFIYRITPNYYEGDRLKKVTSSIQKYWMMGGLWGNRKISRILMTGTMHWKSAHGDIGWLCVPGEGKTNVKVNESKMEIYLADRKAESFEILVYSRNNLPENFLENNWKLDPMNLGIETKLHRIETTVLLPEKVQRIFETPVYSPDLISVVYKIPPAWNTKDPLIIITPEYLNLNYQ